MLFVLWHNSVNGHTLIDGKDLSAGKNRMGCRQKKKGLQLVLCSPVKVAISLCGEMRCLFLDCGKCSKPILPRGNFVSFDEEVVYHVEGLLCASHHRHSGGRLSMPRNPHLFWFPLYCFQPAGEENVIDNV